MLQNNSRKETIMTEFRGFTEKSNTALNMALELAMKLGHTFVGSEHILYGLAAGKDGAASLILSRHGISEKEIAAGIESTMGRGVATRLTIRDFSPKGKRIMEKALELARQDGKKHAGTEYLLSAILAEDGCCGFMMLKETGINTDRLVRDAKITSGTVTKAEKREDKLSSLKKFGIDLTKQAAEGKLDPVFCREAEIDEAVRILLRRRKNNPCFVGESGVGKTAVAEGIALRIAAGEVPEELKKRKIYTLDIPAMIAGAKYRGDFEDRLKSVISEVSSSANDEYRRYIGKDSALERRFQPVTVDEPDEKSTTNILKGIRERYENFHGVSITDDAVKAAVKLSILYLEDRKLPDKAIDLIDEACAAIKISDYKNRPELSEINKKIETLSEEKERAVLLQDFALAAKIREEERALEHEMDRLNQKNIPQKPIVGEKDIVSVVRRYSRMPVINESGRDNTAIRLETELKNRIIGQDRAISAVCSAIKRSRSGINRKNRPLGTFLFSGPTGVGKTELSKALSELMFCDKSALIRFDMSEFMEKHSVSALIGAPAGYAGYDDGGRLVEAVRKKPHSVILFDEIEKAHPDVLNLLLQMLDDGQITAADGRKASLKGCIIIMTTNAGSNQAKSSGMGFNSNADEQCEKELRSFFRPEFLGRIDEIVYFHSLTAENVFEICRNMLSELKSRVEEAGYRLEITDEATEIIAQKGYSKKYGVRDLGRSIIRLVENPVSEEILSGTDRVIIFDKTRIESEMTKSAEM